MLGVCLGSQLLAHTLGAPVYRGKRKEIGWHYVTPREGAPTDPLFKGLESPFVAFHWHGDVFDLPAGSIPLASSELTEHQAFCHGTTAYGLLFHLEVTRAIVEGMTATFAGELAEEGLTPAALLAGSDQYLPSLAARANLVFSAWANLVADRRNVR